MRYRDLGKTGLKLSEVGFGGEFLGCSPEQAREMFDVASEGGINIVDCWMADPVMRSNIGVGVKGRRDKWHIQGHFGSTWQNGQYVRTRDMDAVVPAFEDLFRLIDTDYLDLGMIHYIDEMDDFDRAFNGPFLDYVLEQKKNGRVHHIGLSTHNVEVANAAIDSGVVEMLLFSINAAFDIMPSSTVLDDLFEAGNYDVASNAIDADRAALYARCQDESIGITVMKPYAGGRLLDAKLSPFGVALSPVQCIHYVLNRPAVASVLAGYKTADEIRAALAYETADPEELDYASVLAGAPLHSYSGQCTYCGHCSPCVVGIDIATVNKYSDLAAMQDEIPASVRDHYMALDVRADSCIGCQACEPRCPFGVPIAERMAKTAELFA